VITGTFIVATLLAAYATVAGFVALERRGRGMTTVLIILGLLVIECVLYPDPNNVPTGLFHPGIGAADAASGGGTDYGLSFRLPELLIPAAILARLYATGRLMRVHWATLWWLAFGAWLVVSALVGVRHGNSAGLILFEGKIIVYLGFMLLAAGVPASEYAHGAPFRRFLMGSAVLTTLTIALSEVGSFAINAPGFATDELTMGPDSATIFLCLGLTTLAIGVCSDEGRLRLLLASAPLLFASVSAEQRAALVALAVSLVAFVALAVLGHRRIRTTVTELALVAMAFSSLLLFPLLVTSTSGSRDPVVPIVGDVTATFTTYGKHLSAQSRRYQWQRARELIGENTEFGFGLGTVYRHFDPGPREFQTTNLTHNIALDLLLRTGAIGLGLFAVAFIVTLRDGVRGWLQHSEALVAAIALGATAGVIGLLGKGMVESIFEKYRLATMLGFLLGVVASVTLSLVAHTADEPSESSTSGRRLAWS
jgi:O-antigen ligase/polysaccharide polymerase Wzy-like membrane protein